jgi:hypothetical protein
MRIAINKAAQLRPPPRIGIVGNPRLNDFSQVAATESCLTHRANRRSRLQ